MTRKDGPGISGATNVKFENVVINGMPVSGPIQRIGPACAALIQPIDGL